MEGYANNRLVTFREHHHMHHACHWDAQSGSYTTFLVGITPPGSVWDSTVERGMGFLAKVTSGSVWRGEG